MKVHYRRRNNIRLLFPSGIINMYIVLWFFFYFFRISSVLVPSWRYVNLNIFWGNNGNAEINSEFRNNSFRGKRFPRLSYENTLSITLYKFTALFNGRTKIVPLNYHLSPISANKTNFASLYTTNISFVEVSDVYVNTGNFFFHDDKLYFDDCLCMTYPSQNCPERFTRVDGYFDLIVGFQHAHNQFGHFIFDHFAYLLLLPPKLLKEAYFLYNARPSFMNAYFTIIGVPMTHVLDTSVKQIFHVNRYFYFSPTPCHAMNSFLDLALRGIMRRALSIPRDGVVTPRRYALYNRQGINRIIENDLDLLECFQSLAYEDIVFEIVSDMNTMSETAHYFNEIQVIFSVHGSVFPNIIYMQHGTVYAEHHLEVVYILATSLAYSCGVHSVYSFDGTQSRCTRTVHPRIEYCKYVIKVAMDVLSS